MSGTVATPPGGLGPRLSDFTVKPDAGGGPSALMRSSSGWYSNRSRRRGTHGASSTPRTCALPGGPRRAAGRALRRPAVGGALGRCVRGPVSRRADRGLRRRDRRAAVGGSVPGRTGAAVRTRPAACPAGHERAHQLRPAAGAPRGDQPRGVRGSCRHAPGAAPTISASTRCCPAGSARKMRSWPWSAARARRRTSCSAAIQGGQPPVPARIPGQGVAQRRGSQRRPGSRSRRVCRAARDLEVLSAARVTELVRPGQVLLRLAVHGFGVRLPGAAGAGPPGSAGALRSSGPSRLRSFDPARVADLEFRAWVGYYRRDWPGTAGVDRTGPGRASGWTGSVPCTAPGWCCGPTSCGRPPITTRTAPGAACAASMGCCG